MSVYIFSLDDDSCLDDSTITFDLSTELPVDVFIPGPPGSAFGPLLETQVSDTNITVGPLTQYVVVWATSPIQINLPMASSRLLTNQGVVYALPIIIKNETGVAITLVPAGSDTTEITSDNYQNESVTLLPRTGGYSAI